MKRYLQKRWVTVAILFIICVGFFLRFYQLGQVPSGLGWDEAAIGYNGWSVWTTRRDEWLNRLPISFRSFGDYKAPLAIYLNGPFTLLFGMTTFAVRLPFTIAACLSLIVWWRLLEFIRRQSQFSQLFILYGVALLTFSPWHFVFSRIAFESVICLFLVLLGVWMLLKGIVAKKWKSWLFLLAGLSFVASLYTYHSAKIVVPLLVLSMIVIWRKEILSLWKKLVLPVLVAGLSLIPLAYDSIWGQGATRAGDLVFLRLDSVGEIARSIGSSVIAHFNPLFLLFGQGDELRHVIGNFGIVVPGTMLLALTGVIVFLWNRKNKTARLNDSAKFHLFALSWFFIGMLSGFFSVVFPHANRTLLALPGLLLLTSFGFEQVHKWYVTKSTSWLALLLSILVSVQLLWTIAFFHVYFTEYPKQSEAVFQTGYEEAVEQAKLALKGDNPVDQIIFSSMYGQPYIYVLFYNAISPISYHQGVLIQYLFPDQISITDLARKNALLIFTTKDPLVENVSQLKVSTVKGITDKSLFYLTRTSGAEQ